MNTPKPHPPISATKYDEVAAVNTASINPSNWILNAMKEQLVEIAQSAAVEAPKPKARPKPKTFPAHKNQPLKGHPGLIALKNNLEKR